MNDEAFERLFREYQHSVYGWIVRIVRDPAAAEDLTIETFWRIYRTRERYDETREFGPWARRFATNCALNYLKTVRKTPPRAAALHSLPQQEAFDQKDKIRDAFEALPAKLRIAATLALIEELPYDEIAAALDISVGAVKSRVFRATRKLRSRLERMGITA